MVYMLRAFVASSFLLFSTNILAENDISRLSDSSEVSAEHHRHRPGGGRHGHRRPGYGRPGYGRPGYGRPGYGRPGYGRPGYGRPGYGRPGYGRPGYGRRRCGRLGPIRCSFRDGCRWSFRRERCVRSY